MAQFFETLPKAKRFKAKHFQDDDMIKVFDLKKYFPRRKKTRFFVGTYLEWLNI